MGLSLGGGHGGPPHLNCLEKARLLPPPAVARPTANPTSIASGRHRAMSTATAPSPKQNAISAAPPKAVSKVSQVAIIFFLESGIFTNAS